jgi:hypothetical protein
MSLPVRSCSPLAYTYARNHADDELHLRYGKLGDLAGFTSAIITTIALLIG